MQKCMSFHVVAELQRGEQTCRGRGTAAWGLLGVGERGSHRVQGGQEAVGGPHSPRVTRSPLRHIRDLEMQWIHSLPGFPGQSCPWPGLETPDSGLQARAPIDQLLPRARLSL